MSICSTRPAALDTVSMFQGLVTSLTENVVSAAIMFPEGSTLLPDQLLRAVPNFCVFMTSFTVWVVVVVEFIDPCVKFGVIVLALAAAGDNRAKRRIHFFIVLVYLVFVYLLLSYYYCYL